MTNQIPDWKTQPEEYKKYLEEEIPRVLVESSKRNFKQNKNEEEKAS